MSEMDSEGFLLDGTRRPWKMGRMPESEQEWITEYRLRLESDVAMTRLWSDQRGENDKLKQQVADLAEEKQRLAADLKAPAFHLGKRPETPEEINTEVRLREIERRWEVELEDRKHRAELAFHQSGLVRRAEGVRGWALIAVVFAIIASPWVAIVAGVSAQDFNLYVSPVTGIAGAIIGYWFSQGQQKEIPPPVNVSYPTATLGAEPRE